MNDNKLTSYNFLATLTENGEDLFSTVYIPICKRAISQYSQKGKEYGSEIDIQNEIHELYGLNVPLTVTRQLIKATAKRLSRKEKQVSSLEIFENGKNFKIKIFVFNRYERIYNQLTKDSVLLQKAFEQFLHDNSDIDSIDEEPPRFVDFIDKHKNKLSRFFTGEKINGDDLGNSYLTQIQFIEHVEINNRFLYDLVEKIYFGSVIAGFLESGIDLNAKFLSGEEYYIDTQLILRALNLQNESDTQPAIELLDLIKKLNGKAKLLGITLSEISHVIEVAIGNYNKNTPTTTINEACLRLGNNKSWLIKFNSNLEENIRSQLDIELDTISKTDIEKYKKSRDIKELQGTRKKSANAEHDVLAYLHIRAKRETLVRSYQKAKYWFVSANKKLYQFNISKNSNGVISEIILPDTLTSLLWLKGNRNLDASIKKIGLSELMLQTCHEEIASKELINDFHASVIENTDISDSDYQVLLTSVAHQSAQRIQKLIDLSEENKTKFNDKIHQAIANERERKKRERNLKKDSIEKLQNEIKEKGKSEDRLHQIELQLEANNQSNQIELKKLKDDIKQQDDEISKHKTELRKTKKSIVILMSSIVLLILVLISIEAWNQIKLILTGITGLGGLWGFISLMINILKMTKD